MFLRLILFLTSIAVLARSGPVPVCQLDEVFDGDPHGLALTDNLQLTVPQGDDSPDEIANDLLLHETFGDLRQAPSSARDDAVAYAIMAIVCPCLNPATVIDSSLVTSARALYPPSPPPPARNLPILI